MSRQLLQLMVLLPLIVTPFACKKKPATLIGTWKGTSVMNIGGMTGTAAITLEFKPDGTATEMFNNDHYTGTWTVNSNQLRLDMKSGGGELDDTEAFSLDGDELTIQSFQMSGQPITLDRQ